jgi:hypothetical protein
MQHHAGRSYDESKKKEQKEHGEGGEHGRRRSARENNQDRNISKGDRMVETFLLEKKLVEPAMNADDSYVRRWLAETIEEKVAKNGIETKRESQKVAG